MGSSPYVLILSNPDDYHAFTVAEALDRKGISHGLWYAADFPSLQKASVWLGGHQELCAISGPEFTILPETRPSAVWLRRPGRPVIPEYVDPSDRLFAYRECQTFLAGVQRLLGAEAFWVNPPAGFARANLKIEQLRSAVRNGFQVPETLMSNDPSEIRRFVRARAGQVVYKTFFPASWKSADGVATLFCSNVSLDDLLEDSVLAAVPGIFQALIDKAYEIRLTAIGRHIFAVKIYSQEVPSARMDWRAASQRVRHEPFTLPSGMDKACRAIMKDLGIVFGCFDLIVTPAGDFVFLEVNEMGAFLWLEEEIPELPLVDTFCELLCQGRSNFHISASRPKVRLADVHEAALHRMKHIASPLHVHESNRTPFEASQTTDRTAP